MAAMEGGGDCYAAAARLLLMIGSEANAHLVHGEVEGQGEFAGVRFGHAWVEINGAAIDLSNGRRLCMDRGQYYRLGKIDATKARRYSFTEMVEATAQFGHYGPWENL